MSGNVVVYIDTYNPTLVEFYQIRQFLLQEIIKQNRKVFLLLLSEKKMEDFGQFLLVGLTLENRTKVVGEWFNNCWLICGMWW